MRRDCSLARSLSSTGGGREAAVTGNKTKTELDQGVSVMCDVMYIKRNNNLLIVF